MNGYCLVNFICCTVVFEILCSRFVLEFWMGSFFVVDDISFLLDLLLFEDIFVIIFVDVKELGKVLLYFFFFGYVNDDWL